MADVSKVASRIQVDTSPAVKSLLAMQAAVESENRALAMLKQAALEAGRSMNLIMDEAMKSTVAIYSQRRWYIDPVTPEWN